MYEYFFAVELARQYVDDVEFSAEDGARTDPDFLELISRAVVAAGARTVNIPDTVGYSVPYEYAGLISRIVKALGDCAIVSVHCHDDLGLATANSIAAVEAGARQIECTINGIGERAGNTALEEIVMLFKTRQDRLPYDTGIRTEHLYSASQLLASMISFGPQPNKAIVGRNAFAHEAGIHQDGYLKEKSTYEIMDQLSAYAYRHYRGARHSIRAGCPPRFPICGGAARSGQPDGTEDVRAAPRDQGQVDLRSGITDEERAGGRGGCMGHIRLGNLPRTRKWQEVVGLLEAGAGAPEIAAATLVAAKLGLEDAARDPALVHSFWLLTQLPLCARAGDFVAALNQAGITVTSTPTLLELVGGFADAVDDHVRKTGGRTDLGEIAQMGAAESLTSLLRERTTNLFGTTPDMVRAATVPM